MCNNFIHLHVSYQSLFPYQNKHQNQRVTIKHMYSKKQNGNGGEGWKANNSLPLFDSWSQGCDLEPHVGPRIVALYSNLILSTQVYKWVPA